MYSVPFEAKELFQNGILSNPLITLGLPKHFAKYADKVEFVGGDAPSMPIVWRCAESISAMKAMEATALLTLLDIKYGSSPERVIIDTDHAQLFVMSTLLWEVDPEGEKMNIFNSQAGSEKATTFAKYFPSSDIYNLQGTPNRASCTNIYKAKDKKFFHIHGSMNPNPTLDSLGLPHNIEQPSIEKSWEPYVEKIAQIDSEDLQRLETDDFRQAGTICWTIDEYKNSEHGKKNANIGFHKSRHIKNAAQKPGWWPESAETGPKRPLAGLKIVDISRVIAAPAISRGLAEMGASVIRITAPHLPDFSLLHCDMNWGKWNTHLDFHNKDDLELAKELIREADIVVTGYRPGVLDKYGLGTDGILDLVRNRDRGIIVVKENCYDRDGLWSHRSGWQQISDACCGVSYEYGRAMGNDEPVTPVVPNSDYCCGVAGVTAVISLLIERSEIGGSFELDVALNYYCQWLVNSCGIYDSKVWEDLWSRNGRPVFRHFYNMNYMFPLFFGGMAKFGTAKAIFKDEFFENRDNGAIGKKIKTVKPIIQFPEGEVDLRYNVGTRANGVDKAYWPKYLSTEILV